jgi:hypothetical protein
MSIMVKKSKDIIVARIKTDSGEETYRLRWISNEELYGLIDRYSERVPLPVEEQTEDRKFTRQVKALNSFGYALLHLALVGWENVKDEEGNNVLFSKDLIGMLEISTVGEIWKQYQDARDLAEEKRTEETKN